MSLSNPATDVAGQQCSPLLELEEQEQRVHFVGRERELCSWRQALAGAVPNVFYVYGPGGVGKSSLMREFCGEARRQRDVAVHLINARDLEPTLVQVTAALDAVGLSIARDGADSTRHALIIDSFELLQPIAAQVLRELLRRLGSTTLLAVSSRLPPSAEWRALSLWGTRAVPIALRNLSSAEAMAYLASHGAQGAAAAAMVAFSHGHPLALALALEARRQRPNVPFAPEGAPDVVSALYEYFLNGVPEAPKRTALEIAAILHTTSEATLGVLLESDGASAFAWLRKLSFVEVGARGLYPHDLAREVILAELRWRNPERLAALALRAQRYYSGLLRSTQSAQLAHTFADFSFVLGHNPRLRAMMAPPSVGLRPDDLKPEDERALCAAVLRHEGARAARDLQHWISRQPAAFRIVRNEDGTPAAFAANLRLDLTTADERAADERVSATWAYALGVLGGPPHGPLNYCRFAMALETHQAPSPAMAMCWQFGGAALFVPGITLSFGNLAEGRTWADLVTFSGARFVPELAHEVAGRAYEVTLQDQRGISPADWLSAMNERTAIGDWREEPVARVVEASLTTLSKPEFQRCVRDALRCMHDLDPLAKNPLIHSRPVRARVEPRASPRARAVALQAVLYDQAQSLRGSTRKDAWYQVLDAAYLRPVGKHETAAAELGLSYATFRRHLTTATQRLVAALWDQDNGAALEERVGPPSSAPFRLTDRSDVASPATD